MPMSRKPHRTSPSSSAATRRRARSSRFQTPSQRAARQATRVRPSVAQGAITPDNRGIKLPLGSNEVMLTRRHFLFGALGIGALAAVATGITLARSGDDNQSEGGITVPEHSVFDLDDCSEVNADDCFTLIGEWELPFGTLLWTNSDTIAACLEPTEQASPLTKVALLQLQSGNYTTVLEQAVGAADGYEIYDVRASEKGVVWTEANIMQGTWRIMCAALGSDLALSEAHILEEGDKLQETPTIGAVGNNAYWQVMPSVSNENSRTEPSYLKRAGFSEGGAQVLHEATGRMSCPLYASNAGVTIAARNPESHSTFDLMYFDDASGKPTDVLTLPSGMAPNALGFGPNGISFCFESIYDYGDGISNLGTYTPAQTHQPGASYDSLLWFRFGRTPQASPCWCADRWLMVKSTTAVCGIDLEQRQYCSLDVQSGCADWGDYLATSGAGNTVASIMQIDQVNAKGETEHKAVVRVWQAYDGPVRVDEDNDGYDDSTGELIEASTETNGA